MKIIYVHGIAQERKNPAALKAEWDDALRKGLAAAGLAWPAGAETVLPYYGDTLADKTAEIDRGEAVGLIRRGGTTAEDASKYEFYNELLSQLAAGKGVSTADLVGDDGRPVERGPQNWRWVLALTRRLNKVGPLADWSIDTFTRDVWVYLLHNQVRQPIHAIVGGAIPATDPCVVVSHSLGTVVAYNVLTEKANRDNVRAWLTLGSPLGIEAIYKRLPSSLTPVPRKAPAGIATWYNARDPEDIVALHEIPGGRFGGDPAVENSSHVVNPTSNQHGIIGYLSDAEVARRIAKVAGT